MLCKITFDTNELPNKELAADLLVQVAGVNGLIINRQIEDNYKIDLEGRFQHVRDTMDQFYVNLQEHTKHLTKAHFKFLIKKGIGTNKPAGMLAQTG